MSLYSSIPGQSLDTASSPIAAFHVALRAFHDACTAPVDGAYQCFALCDLSAAIVRCILSSSHQVPIVPSSPAAWAESGCTDSACSLPAVLHSHIYENEPGTEYRTSAAIGGSLSVSVIWRSIIEDILQWILRNDEVPFPPGVPLHDLCTLFATHSPDARGQNIIDALLASLPSLAPRRITPFAVSPSATARGAVVIAVAYLSAVFAGTPNDPQCVHSAVTWVNAVPLSGASEDAVFVCLSAVRSVLLLRSCLVGLATARPAEQRRQAARWSGVAGNTSTWLWSEEQLGILGGAVHLITATLMQLLTTGAVGSEDMEPECRLHLKSHGVIASDNSCPLWLPTFAEFFLCCLDEFSCISESPERLTKVFCSGSRDAPEAAFDSGTAKAPFAFRSICQSEAIIADVVNLCGAKNVSTSMPVTPVDRSPVGGLLGSSTWKKSLSGDQKLSVSPESIPRTTSIVMSPLQSSLGSSGAFIIPAQSVHVPFLYEIWGTLFSDGRWALLRGFISLLMSPRMDHPLISNMENALPMDLMRRRAACVSSWGWWPSPRSLTRTALSPNLSSCRWTSVRTGDRVEYSANGVQSPGFVMNLPGCGAFFCQKVQQCGGDGVLVAVGEMLRLLDREPRETILLKCGITDNELRCAELACSADTRVANIVFCGSFCPLDLVAVPRPSSLSDIALSVHFDEDKARAALLASNLLTTEASSLTDLCPSITVPQCVPQTAVVDILLGSLRCCEVSLAAQTRLHVLLTEFYSLGSLTRYVSDSLTQASEACVGLHTFCALPDIAILCIFAEAVEAMADIAPAVVYADLKSDNFVVSSPILSSQSHVYRWVEAYASRSRGDPDDTVPPILKLIDFGEAFPVRGPARSIRGTSVWLSPEEIIDHDCNNPSNSLDTLRSSFASINIWRLGILLYWLLTATDDRKIIARQKGIRALPFGVGSSAWALGDLSWYTDRRAADRSVQHAVAVSRDGCTPCYGNGTRVGDGWISYWLRALLLHLVAPSSGRISIQNLRNLLRGVFRCLSGSCNSQSIRPPPADHDCQVCDVELSISSKEAPSAVLVSGALTFLVKLLVPNFSMSTAPLCLVSSSHEGAVAIALYMAKAMGHITQDGPMRFLLPQCCDEIAWRSNSALSILCNQSSVCLYSRENCGIFYSAVDEVNTIKRICSIGDCAVTELPPSDDVSAVGCDEVLSDIAHCRSVGVSSVVLYTNPWISAAYDEDTDVSSLSVHTCIPQTPSNSAPKSESDARGAVTQVWRLADFFPRNTVIPESVRALTFVLFPQCAEPCLDSSLCLLPKHLQNCLVSFTPSTESISMATSASQRSIVESLSSLRQAVPPMSEGAALSACASHRNDVVLRRVAMTQSIQRTLGVILAPGIPISPVVLCYNSEWVRLSPKDGRDHNAENALDTEHVVDPSVFGSTAKGQLKLPLQLRSQGAFLGIYPTSCVDDSSYGSDADWQRSPPGETVGLGVQPLDDRFVWSGASSVGTVRWVIGLA